MASAAVGEHVFYFGGFGPKTTSAVRDHSYNILLHSHSSSSNAIVIGVLVIINIIKLSSDST